MSGQSPDGLGDRRSVVGKGDRETREYARTCWDTDGIR